MLPLPTPMPWVALISLGNHNPQEFIKKWIDYMRFIRTSDYGKLNTLVMLQLLPMLDRKKLEAIWRFTMYKIVNVVNFYIEKKDYTQKI